MSIALADVSVSRTVPKLENGKEATITLSINNDKTDKLDITELIPAGWGISDWGTAGISKDNAVLENYDNYQYEGELYNMYHWKISGANSTDFKIQYKLMPQSSGKFEFVNTLFYPDGFDRKTETISVANPVVNNQTPAVDNQTSVADNQTPATLTGMLTLPITGAAVTVNWPPDISISITPSYVFDNSNLTCIWKVKDDEQVTIEQNWYRNDKLTDFSAVVPSYETNVGDKWTCKVSATDTFNATSVKNASVIIHPEMTLTACLVPALISKQPLHLC